MVSNKTLKIPTSNNSKRGLLMAFLRGLPKKLFFSTAAAGATSYAALRTFSYFSKINQEVKKDTAPTQRQPIWDPPALQRQSRLASRGKR
jgi:hypothetical protein